MYLKIETFQTSVYLHFWLLYGHTTCPKIIKGNIALTSMYIYVCIYIYIQTFYNIYIYIYYKRSWTPEEWRKDQFHLEH
jgi:hypothetical protein